mmetsp:Transcript_40831/g.96954  ORF Transcript_40831/g.96954 Transcript_40831/m.96954 type:complete len:750 (-) Transcript_40831:319-2568(-)
MSLLTYEIPLESSVHGELRREQRNITKNDLKAAVKYGKKEPGWPDPRTKAPRWKYTFADVVYITDETSTREITSYAVALPFTKTLISSRAMGHYEEGKRRVLDLPETVTSHSVFVVDKSGSMKKGDVSGHPTRARAVYYNLGEEYLAPLLRRDGVSHTDLITVIEMREGPSVVVSREPRSWVLYNRFVDLSENRDTMREGFYRETLTCAFECLERGSHEKCALSLFFLSDGKPSDKGADAHHLILSTVSKQSSAFGGRLTFVALGFGSESQEFHTLQQMTSQSKAAGADAMYVTGLDASALKTAFSSASSSLTRTRTLLSRLAPEEPTPARGERQLVASTGKEIYSSTQPFDAAQWRIRNSDSLDLARHCSVERKMLKYTLKERFDNITGMSRDVWVPEWTTVPFQHSDATGIAIRKIHFAEGAERIVFGMREINAQGKPVGKPLVAKDSKYRLLHAAGAHAHEKFKFHKRFVQTQMAASKLAVKFNERLARLNLKTPLPQIEFIACSVYFARSRDGTIDECFLAEPEIDPDRYKKWSNNQGGVDGIALENAVPTPDQLATMPTVGASSESSAAYRIHALQEEDEEEESDGEQEHSELSGVCLAKQREQEALAARVLDCDIPHAFSHYSYVFSRRTKLVCDIQGVFHDAGPSETPRFLLTDPCIHCHSERSDRGFRGPGRPDKRYGRTDHGRAGMHSFFKTHQCNKACELLGLHANPIPVRADRGIDHARTAPATHPRGHLPGPSQHAV